MEEEIITNEELVALLEASAQETLIEFNFTYGTDYTLDQETLDYLLAFAIASLFGVVALRGRADIPQSIKDRVLNNLPTDYEGLKATTRKEYQDLVKKLGREPLAQELEAFRQKRLQTIIDGVFYGTSLQLEAYLAEQDGRAWVGAVTQRDSRVRPDHRKHDGAYWRLSTYQPWYDYNCRCSYIYFQSEQQASQAGFTKL